MTDKPTVTPLTAEGAEVLADDLAHLDAGQYRLVADWMLDHGWTEPLDPLDAARTDSLDVERLARALLDPHWQIAFHRWMTTGWSNTKNDEARPLAVKLAAEYARLDKEPKP